MLVACGAKSQVQDSPELRMSKDIGYSSFGGGDIQGSFTIAYSGPDTVMRVVFLIDGESLADEQGTYPFTAKFNTGSYSLGRHTLMAIGYTETGAEFRTKEIVVNFVSASEGWKASLKIAGPILGLVILVTIIGIGLPALLNRGKLHNIPAGTPRNYGLRGGTVCPRCHRPYALHLFSLHLAFYMFDRCPYCGKWALVRSRSLTELRAAEKAEIEQESAKSQPGSDLEEEKLRKDLEDSRYQDL